MDILHPMFYQISIGLYKILLGTMIIIGDVLIVEGCFCLRNRPVLISERIKVMQTALILLSAGIIVSSLGFVMIL